MARAVRFDLIADSSKFTRGMRDAQRSSEGFTKHTSAAGRALRAATAAFSVGVVVTQMHSWVDAARDSNKTAAQTATVLESTHNAAGLTADQFAKLAAQISKTSAVDDDLIQSGENIIATFTNIHGDVFKKTTQAAVDMTAAMNHGEVTQQGLQSSAVQLGKALNDPLKGLTALQRVGVTFSAQQKAQIADFIQHGQVAKAQGVILAEVNKEFGGSAAAAVTPAKQLAVTWGNMQEVLGNLLIPAIDKGAKILNGILGVIDRNRTAFGVLGAAIAAVTGFVVAMTVAEKIHTAITTAVTVATKAWAVAQKILNFALAANPIGLVVVAIAALAAGIIYAYKHSETFRKIVDGAFKAIRLAVGTAVNFIIGMLRHWLDFQFSVVAGILHVMGKLPGPMGAPFRAAEKAVVGAKKTVDTQLDKIQARVNQLSGKDIPITASLKLNFSPSYTQKDWVRDRQRAGRLAGGGLVQGPGGPTADMVPALLSAGEFVVNAKAVRSLGVDTMKQLNAMRFATGGPIGRIDTQNRAINKIEAFGTGTRLHAGIAAFMAAFGGIGGGAFTGGAASGNVIRLALAQAKRMAASFKVALALIEAGIVESGLRNLPYGDRDSLGFLQQRPSQGWRHPMNISYASWDFLRRAIPIQGRYSTAGRLAQAVQRSAFPARYDQQQARALGILSAYGYDKGGVLPSGMLALNTTGRPEALGFDYDKMAEANTRALARHLHGARVELDGQQIGRLIVNPMARELHRLVQPGAARA